MQAGGGPPGPPHRGVIPSFVTGYVGALGFRVGLRDAWGFGCFE